MKRRARPPRIPCIGDALTEVAFSLKFDSAEVAALTGSWRWSLLLGLLGFPVAFMIRKLRDDWKQKGVVEHAVPLLARAVL